MSSKFRLNRTKWSGNIPNMNYGYNASNPFEVLSSLDLDGPMTRINEMLRATDFIEEIPYTKQNAKMATQNLKLSELNLFANDIIGDVEEHIDNPFFKKLNDNGGVLETLERIKIDDYEIDNNSGFMEEYQAQDMSYRDAPMETKRRLKKKIGFADYLGNGILENGSSLPSFGAIYKEQYGAAYDAYVAEINKQNDYIKKHGRPDDGLISKMSYNDFVKEQITRTNLTHSVDRGWITNLAADIADMTGIGLIYSAFTGERAFTGEELTSSERNGLAGKMVMTAASYAALIATCGASSLKEVFLRLGADMLAGSAGMATAAALKEAGAPDWLQALAGAGVGIYVGVKLNKWITASVKGSTGDGFKQLSKVDDFTDDIMKTKPKNSPVPDKWLSKGGSIDFDDTTGFWKYKDIDGNSVIYKNGYPDFTPYKHPSVDSVNIEIAQPKNNAVDFKAANEAAGLSPTSNPPVFNMGQPPVGYTWHHLEDGKTMILVERDIHKTFTHIGGQSIINGK